MIGDQHADAALLQLADQVANVRNRQRIDARERLVEQHDRRVGGQRAGDLGAAPLAARQRHRRGCAQPRQPEFVEQRFEPQRALGLVGHGKFEHAKDVLLDRHPAKDRGFLRQIAEAEDRAAIHRQSGDIVAVEHDAARIGLHQSHYRIEAGRLARAVRAEQPDHFALADRERNVGQHRPLVIGFRDRHDRQAIRDRCLGDRRCGI